MRIMCPYDIYGQIGNIGLFETKLAICLAGTPGINCDPDDIEVIWDTPRRLYNSADFTVEILYTVGENGFEDDQALHNCVRDAILSYLLRTTHLWDGLSCAVWVRPQHGAGFKMERRTEK